MLYSPLRYPGGKNKLSAFISKLCMDNDINGHYVEPYAGGASVALFLLMRGYVKNITINDKDKAIYAFWHSVLYMTDELCELISNCEISIETWKQQKDIQLNKDSEDLLKVGFSTFFLNRTNRSGIINAGVIGGNEQKGDYKLDCRFNKQDLIKRIKLISSKKANINIYSLDAIDLISKIEKEAEDDNIIFYFDPPYYLKASTLYMNHYQENDHESVSDRIKSIRNIKWIVSYDNVPEIQKMYKGCNKKEYSFKHTAYHSRTGNEILFFSNNLRTPSIENWNPTSYKLKKVKNAFAVVYKEPKQIIA
ncbi:DNA adenine methylase [uncultured Pedobacter sp.]|uniref:DNA adenine methylase n=1 Tax=uncultured Pedobacter sp. TaxID=246139 RepID=UPI0025F2F0AA|nr:DNA adenine methylase [uncultured Pedobacter sp.]